MKNRSMVALILALALTIFAFAGCVSNNPQTPATQELETSKPAENKLPAGYPEEELPLYEDVKVLAAQGNADKGFSVQYESKAAPEEVVRFYKDKLGKPANEQHDKQLDQTILEWAKPYKGMTYNFAVTVREKVSANDYGAKTLVITFILPMQQPPAESSDAAADNSVDTTDEAEGAGEAAESAEPADAAESSDTAAE